MSDIKHQTLQTNGIWMHIAEKGQGPLVLLIHGFPELWSSWTYQINHLAEHGYHVVAPDMRGYGDSDCPLDPASYTTFHLVGDLIGLLDQLGEEKAFVVGHDWGATIAWFLCLFRPDRVKALVNLGVPYQPRSIEFKPTEFLSKIFGEGFYVSQFQELGRAEKSYVQRIFTEAIKSPYWHLIFWILGPCVRGLNFHDTKEASSWLWKFVIDQ